MTDKPTVEIVKADVDDILQALLLEARDVNAMVAQHTLNLALTRNAFWSVHLKMVLELLRVRKTLPTERRVQGGGAGDEVERETTRILEAMDRFTEELEAYNARMNAIVAKRKSEQPPA